MHRLPILGASLAVVLATACVTIAPPIATDAPSTPRRSTATPTATAEPRTAIPSRPPLGSVAPTQVVNVSPPASAESDQVAWRPCQGGLECATLEVPMDYDNPANGTVEVSLIRHRARPTARLGSLVMNPGGPGASGVDWVRNAWQSFGPEITREFDIVGFDPRGVGQSDPIRCLDSRPELTDAFPENPAEERAFVDSARAVTEACQQNSGDLLPFVGTENVARDLDKIRDALGEAQLTYFGFSYGTLIGAYYADMFPAHVRAMVLDGPVDPSMDIGTFVNTQSKASQSELDEFLVGCAEESSCSFSTTGDPQRAFDALLDRFDQGPIGGVTAPVALAAVYQELVIDDDAGLDTILGLAQQGVTSPMADAGSWAVDARALDGYDAVNCLDYAMPRTKEGFAQLARDAAEVAPDIGAWNTYTYFDCAFWPVEATRVPRPIAAEGAPVILVLAATGDPATPYEWGTSLADQLSSGVLVTRNGDGHTSFHFSDCVREIATSYVLELTAPADGTTCD